MSQSLDLAPVDAGEARAADLPVSYRTIFADPVSGDCILVSLMGTGGCAKSRACSRNACINEGSLQHQLTLLSFYQHLNILNPSRALTLLLTPSSTLLSLWFVACKTFDDVDSQEGVSDGQHQAASKGGTTSGHSCHMHLLLQCY